MATEVGSIRVSAIGDVSNLRGSLNLAAKVTEDAGRKIERRVGLIERSFAGLGARLGKIDLSGALGLGALAGAASVTGILAGIRTELQAISQIRADAAVAGLDVEKFQELKYAAESAKIGTDALTDGLKELQLRADEFVTTGGGSAAEAFQRLGYTAEDLKKKLRDPAALFEEIITKLGRLDKAAQIRVADEIFGGTAGEQFLRWLDGSTVGIAQLRDEARLLGVVVDESLVQKTAEAEREFKRVETAIQGTARTMIAELSGPIRDELASFLKTIKEVAYAWNQFKEGNFKEGLGFAWGPNAPQDLARRQLRAGLGDQLTPSAAQDFYNAVGRTPAAPSAPSAPSSAPSQSASGGSAAASMDRLAESYARLEQAAQARIAALKVEKETIGLTTAEAEKMRMEQDLFAQAQSAGLTLTDQQKAKLSELAAQYGQVAAAAEAAAEKQAAIQQAFGHVQSIATSTFTGIVRDIREGESASDAFAKGIENLAASIADMVVEMLIAAALKAALAPLTGGASLGFPMPGFSSGGAVGFDAGGFTGPGGKNDVAGLVHRGEYVFSAKAVRSLGLHRLNALHEGAVRGYAQGGYVGGAAMSRMAGQASFEPRISVINNTGVEAQPQVKTGPDGSMEIILNAVEGRLANRVANNKGTLARAMKGRGLRDYTKG